VANVVVLSCCCAVFDACGMFPSNLPPLQALVFSPDGTMRKKLAIDHSELLAAAQDKKKGLKLRATGADATSALPTADDLRVFLADKFPGLSVQRIPSNHHAEVAVKVAGPAIRVFVM
jgi:hypothetical protein